MKLTLTKSWLFNVLTVASSSMDFVLVFLLILDFLSPGQSSSIVASESCYEKCPPGYYKVGDCTGRAAEQHKCKKCAEGTYTDINSAATRCEACTVCGSYETVIKNCSFDSNTKCDCKENYYNASSITKDMDCQLCPCIDCKEPKNHASRKCQDCRSEEISWCWNNKECKRICGKFLPPSVTATTTSTSATTSTTSSATTTTPTLMDMTSISTRTTASKGTSPPVIAPVNHRPWQILVGAVIIFLVVFLLLLLLPRNLERYPDCFPRWIAKKGLKPPVEETKFKDQRSHQGNGPTIMTLTISEETPMMPLNQSPAPSEHRAPHSGPVLPDAEHKAARQDEHSEHWPAIILYAIIKEVPLRRWKEFLRLLSVADQQLERVELEAGLGLGSMERQYQMLRLWSQRSTASLNDVFSALHYMDLSGCAQLLQESLEKLKWRPFTDHGFNGAMQET